MSTPATQFLYSLRLYILTCEGESTPHTCPPLYYPRNPHELHDPCAQTGGMVQITYDLTTIQHSSR